MEARTKPDSTQIAAEALDALAPGHPARAKGVERLARDLRDPKPDTHEDLPTEDVDIEDVATAARCLYRELEAVLEQLTEINSLSLHQGMRTMETLKQARKLGVLRTPSGVPAQHSADHLAVLDAMRAYGGSFVEALSDAWRRADCENHRQLYRAFSGYWNRYAERFVTTKRGGVA